MRLLAIVLWTFAISFPGSAAANEVFRVPSHDGATISVECAGTGPMLLMVHGGIGDRTRWTPMLPLLAPRFTACAMDRRGHGESSDGPSYSMAKEADDIIAVVNSRPGPVYVLGHSYGGVAALEAALRTKRIAKLILYEPPLRDPVAHNLDVTAQLEKLIAAGDRDGAVATFLAEVVHVSKDEIAVMKTRPGWKGLVASIDSHPRQMRALASYQFDAKRAKRLKTPTLLLLGGATKSVPAKESIRLLQDTLPDASLVVLEGQEHNAMDGARALLANTVAGWLSVP